MQLSPGYEHYSDASEGPLQPGVVGTLVEEDGSGKPYRVEAPNGKKWWYEKGALQAAQVRACFEETPCSWLDSPLHLTRVLLTRMPSFEAEGQKVSFLAHSILV